MNDELARKGSRSASEAPADVLLALAERCERESGGMHLDQAVLSALGYTWRGMAYWHRDNSHTWKHSSKLTTSLDAAVSLVPEGDSVFWRLGHDGEGPDPSLFRADVLDCRVAHPLAGCVARSETPALALCAAALRARAAVAEASVSPAREAGRTPPPSKDPNT